MIRPNLTKLAKQQYYPSYEFFKKKHLGLWKSCLMFVYFVFFPLLFWNPKGVLLIEGDCLLLEWGAFSYGFVCLLWFHALDARCLRDLALSNCYRNKSAEPLDLNPGLLLRDPRPPRSVRWGLFGINLLPIYCSFCFDAKSC